MFSRNTCRAGAFGAMLLACCAASVGHAATEARGETASAVQADRARHLEWRLTAQGVAVTAGGASNRRDIVLPGWQWVAARGTCPPALRVMANGEVFVTSNIVPTLWRIDPRDFTVRAYPLALSTDAARDLGFSGLAYSPRHRALFVLSDVQRSLWRVDAKLTTARKVRVSPAALPQACGLELAPPASAEGVTLCLGDGKHAVRLDAAGERGEVTRTACVPPGS